MQQHARYQDRSGNFKKISDAELAAARANIAVYSDYVRLKRSGNSIVGLCPFHDDHSPSFSIKGGRWTCFSGCGDPSHGDTIDFVMRLRRIGFAEAVRDLCGSESAFLPRHLPQSRDGARVIVPPPAAPSRNDAYIRELWAQATEPKLAELYLESRGIRWRPKPLPSALRGHSGVPCAESHTDRPAMLAALQAGPAGEIVAMQRIWIERSYVVDRTICPKGTQAADLKAPKKTIGNCQDGAVRLFEPDTRLGLTEGVEDALAVHQLYRTPCWAATGASRMPAVGVPDSITKLVIYSQWDAADPKSGRRCAQHWAEETAKRHRGKREVEIVYPPEPYKDYCEMVARP